MMELMEFDLNVDTTRTTSSHQAKCKNIVKRCNTKIMRLESFLRTEKHTAIIVLYLLQS